MPCYHVDRIEVHEDTGQEIAVLVPDDATDGSTTIDVPNRGWHEGEAVCMGEYSEFPGADQGGGTDTLGVPYENSGYGYGSDPDTQPTGTSGDPFGGDGADYNTAEAAPLGALPGGAESQFSPFSPGGGFDFSNIMKGKLGGGGQIAPAGFSIGGPFGINFGDGVNAGGSGLPAGRGGGASASQTGMILRQLRQSTGLRITAQAIVGLIVRYGFQAVAKMTGLGAQQLLYLFLQRKAVRHHKRGPGIYTIARKKRAYDRMMHTVSRVLGRGGGHSRRRARRPYHAFHKRRRRR